MDKLEQNYDDALALFAGAFLFSRYPIMDKKIIFVKMLSSSYNPRSYEIE